MECRTFVNKGYKAEWKPGYAQGDAYCNEDGSWAVYDGGQNYMGKVNADGRLTYNGTKSDYKESFLLAAKEALGL